MRAKTPKRSLVGATKCVMAFLMQAMTVETLAQFEVWTKWSVPIVPGTIDGNS